jgi:hypothetical protein
MIHVAETPDAQLVSAQSRRGTRQSEQPQAESEVQSGFQD